MTSVDLSIDFLITTFAHFISATLLYILWIVLMNADVASLWICLKERKVR